ncbi:YjcQ family protein [Clostridium merdae]|uniref:YjcQ family protein n=1 Tax=Clostridium merdae TaxID=1958780 RepID=UPI000A26B6E8|nr:YjcQ family protein [Clostridium merdae]
MAIDQLKVAFSILHELSEESIPKEKDYGLSDRQFVHIVLDLQDKGYIRNAVISLGDDELDLYIDEAYVTLDGLQFLHDNSTLMKTYKGLKAGV